MDRAHGRKMLYYDFNGISEPEALKLIKERFNPSTIDDKDNIGDTILIESARYAYETCVSYALSIGANPNAEAFCGTPAIGMSNNYNIIRNLLNAGATPDSISLRRYIRLNNKQLAYLFIDRGVSFDKTSIFYNVQWFTEFIDWRNQTRHTAIMLMSIHKFKRSPKTKSNNRDVFRLIV
jgi:ankyrin repeat protein